jgi:6-phosphogluconate dehydrogenase
MNKEYYEIGMIGLGVMGRNMVLNISDHGSSIAGYDKDKSKISQLDEESADRKILAAQSLEEFIKALKKPRAVILLVPAGKVVDSVIAELLPMLESDDMIIDAGNSHFTDTDRRAEELHDKKIHFMGMGVSGGEYGARYGPSIMPGGPKDAYERVEDILKGISAKAGGDPCVTYLGPRSAGHYVKMVHNGIEYGVMQLIAETYDLMKRGLGLTNDELHDVYAGWNDGELASFLVKITADIFKQPDEKTNNRLVDMIRDAAKQKGTGKWTSQDAMELQVPVPTIDVAVAMRDLSGYKSERTAAEKILSGPEIKIDRDKKRFINSLGNALYFSMIATYAQGMALLRKASETYEYNLKLKDVASIWRDGCIIRSRFLENIRAAYDQNANLNNLLIDPGISRILIDIQNDLREIVAAGIASGIPVPALAASLAYYDGYRSGQLPANLIQAQRDYFGSHTYERTDREGIFHTHWQQD